MTPVELTLGVIGILCVIVPLLVTMLFWQFGTNRDAKDALKAAATAFKRAEDAEAHAEKLTQGLREERQKLEVGYNSRLEKAESAAVAVNGLAQAIEHLTQRFTDKLEAVVSRMDDHHGFIRSEIAEIRHAQSNAKMIATKRAESKPTA